MSQEKNGNFPEEPEDLQSIGKLYDIFRRVEDQAFRIMTGNKEQEELKHFENEEFDIEFDANLVNNGLLLQSKALNVLQSKNRMHYQKIKADRENVWLTKLDYKNIKKAMSSDQAYDEYIFDQTDIIETKTQTKQLIYDC